jgi:1,4-dihydroxy-2-naphthoate octaprenyltransferase
MNRRAISAFLRLGRMHFLVGGFVFHGLGVTVAAFSGTPFNLPALLWGQIAITAAQWMTHYGNDYFDLEADLANPTPSRWSGGSRVLPDGDLSPRTSLITAICFMGLSLTATFILAFVIKTGALTLPILLFSIAAAWFYSAPPLRLHSRGLGEVVVTLVVPGLTSLIGFYLQVGRLDTLIFLAIFPLMCLQFVMMLSVEYPDLEGDALTGKRTLVVRWGRQGAARAYLLALGLAYLSLPLLVTAGMPKLVVVAVALISPVAMMQAWRIRRGDYADPARWNLLAFYSVVLLMGTALAEILAFLLLLGGVRW